MPGHFDSTSSSVSVLDGSLRAAGVRPPRAAPVAGGDEDAVTLAAEAAFAAARRGRAAARRADPRHDVAAVRRGRQRAGARRADGPRRRHPRTRADLVAPRRAHGRPRSQRALVAHGRHGARLWRAPLTRREGRRGTVRPRCCSPPTAAWRRSGPARRAPRSSAIAGGSRVRPSAQRRRPELRLGRRTYRASPVEWGLERAVRRRPDRARRRRVPSARLGGPGDELAGAVGRDRRRARARAARARASTAAQTVVAGSGGLGRGPVGRARPGAEAVAARARAVLEAPRSATPPEPVRLEPADARTRPARAAGASAARICGSRARAAAGAAGVLFPPPVDLPALRQPASCLPELLARAGTVVTETSDHAYPVSRSTGMAVVELDGGGTVLRPGRPLGAGRDRRPGAARARAGCTTAAAPSSTSGSSRRRR